MVQAEIGTCRPLVTFCKKYKTKYEWNWTEQLTDEKLQNWI